jgi:hypothetical protein
VRIKNNGSHNIGQFHTGLYASKRMLMENTAIILHAGQALTTKAAEDAAVN